MQGEDVVEGLMLLFQRLRNEAERNACSPSMRLLDDLLLIMDAEHGSSETARLEAAAERMDTAFDPSGSADATPPSSSSSRNLSIISKRDPENSPEY